MPHFNGVCDYCNQPFHAYRGPSRKTPPRYCSRACHDKGWAKAQTFICEECNKPFNACITEARNNPRFCSRGCRNKNVASIVDVICQECGKVFRTNSSFNRKYCSKKCTGKHSYMALRKKAMSSQTSEDRFCPVCNNALNRRQRSGGRIFCSRECWHRWGVEHGTFCIKEQADNAGYRGPNWQQQRRNARARDDYTCQRCGITELTLGVQLSVHHIIPFKSFSLDNYVAANALENLLCLCESCHGIIEQTEVFK